MCEPERIVMYIGDWQPCEALAAELGDGREVLRLDPVCGSSECFRQNAAFLLLSPSEDQWRALDRYWIGRIVSYVINGGTVLAFRGAFTDTEHWEMVQLLGAGAAYFLPWGELRLRPEAVSDMECSIWAEPVLLRPCAFASIQPLVQFPYGAGTYPALWRHAWGKGTALCSVLDPRAFWDSAAGDMLRMVLRNAMTKKRWEEP